MKRLFVDSPFKAARQYAELKTAMQESNSHSGIFLLFPYLHMGGAEKVHVAIAESVADQRPWIIIAGFSTSAVFAPDFRKHGKLLDIPHAANHPFYARRVRAMLAQFISAQHRPVVLGCANFLFYDLVGQVSPQVQCIDLKHDFRLDLDTQVEQKLLKTYLRMNQRVFISQRAIQETIRFYSSNFVNRSFLDRIHLILNWVPVPPSAPRKNSEGPLRVLYAGRGTKEKRAQLVCRLAAEVHKRAMPCTFTVAGDIREAVKEEDYPFVRFLGEVRDAEEMKKIYADAQVILITSQREGFPMAIMEGMANGAVPVSSPVGDIPRHLEEGLNGFVTRTEQEEPMIEEMLDILNKLAADRTLLNTLSGNAYRYAFAHFQKENFVSAYRHLMGLQ
jgi:glycosyltransferase involved in cell wall biosynthesis